MRGAARAVWAQFELLLLQQRVLYIKSAAHTTQAKLWMVVPKQLVEQALVEVHDGVAGAHLRGMESLMKMKARFWRPGVTEEVHGYYDRCLTCAKCKRRGKPRAPLATPRNASILTLLLPCHGLGEETDTFSQFSAVLLTELRCLQCPTSVPQPLERCL